MNQKLALLAERRQMLILKAAAQRAALAQNTMPLRKPLIIADRSLQVIGYFKKHPILMLGTTTLLGIIRPDRFNKWLHTGWSAFQLVRNVRSWLVKD